MTPHVYVVEYVRCNTTRQCMPESWLCDGEIDCDGGQDENSTICGKVFSHCPVGCFLKNIF